MATTIGAAYVQILPTMDGIGNSLQQQLSGATNTAAAAAGESSGGSLASGIASGLAAGAAVITAAAGTALAGTTALVNSVAEYGDEIDKNSQKLGVSSTFYQEWDAVLQHSGTSMDSMSATFKKLANAAQDASDDQVAAFEALGMSMDDVASMSTEDLFTNVITGLQGMEEGTERTALATDLLGKGATELGALFNTSAEDTQAMIDKVNELGGVMSEDAIASAAAYEDTLQDMQTAFGSIKNEIGAELMPVFTDMMNMVIDNMPAIKEAIQPVVESIGTWVADIATWVTEHGDLIQGIISAVTDAIGTAWAGIETIFESLKTAIATVAESFDGAGVDIEDVWNGIGDVFNTVVEIISLAIETAGEAIAWLVEEATTEGTLFNTIWENVQTVFSTCFEAITGILETFQALLAGDFSGALESAGGVVSTVFGGMWTIIKNNMDWAKDKVKTVVEAIKGFLDFEFTWPHIPLPHFGITPEGWSIGDLLEGSIPSLGIEWYAKGMDEAQILSGAQIFGIAGGRFLGGGEAGNEVVVGEQHLLDMFKSAVTASTDSRLEAIYVLMTQFFPEFAKNREIRLDTGELVSALSTEVDNRLGQLYDFVNRGYAW